MTTIAPLHREVIRHINNGYRILAQTESTAQLVKPKRFSFGWFLLLALFGVFPGILYIAWYASKQDNVVYLWYDDSSGTVQRQYRGMTGWTKWVLIGLAVYLVIALMYAAVN